MKRSFVSFLGYYFKKITGIKDISLLKKNIHKNVGKFLYHQKYSACELVKLMQDMGMKAGSVVCIHSSMKEFYNYRGTAEELISQIIEVVGSEGTLIMPAFPDKSFADKEDYVFSLNDKTGAGYLAETFRKFPNVKRSINVQHSVCAWGKYAEWLVKDHHKCHDCWDKDSPWQRMMEVDAIVFNFGLPRWYIGTFHHCVESVLQYEHPYWAQFFTKEKVYKYYDSENSVKEYKSFVGSLDRRTKESHVTNHFDDNDWKICKVSNLEVKAFYTSSCYPKMLELGRKGIGVYYVPSPKKYKF